MSITSKEALDKFNRWRQLISLGLVRQISFSDPEKAAPESITIQTSQMVDLFLNTCPEYEDYRFLLEKKITDRYGSFVKFDKKKWENQIKLHRIFSM